MHFDRITSNPAVMNGQPTIRGTRLTVRRVLDLVATYADRAELRREFSELEDEDIRQALEYAGALVADREGEAAALTRPFGMAIERAPSSLTFGDGTTVSGARARCAVVATAAC